MNLNHATPIAIELQRSIGFYRRLGLVHIAHAPPRYARFVRPQGDGTPFIGVTGEAASAARTWLYFECDAADQRVEQLRAADAVLRQPLNDIGDLWREARLSDPDGHEERPNIADRKRRKLTWNIDAADRCGRCTRAVMDAAPSKSCKALPCGESPPVDRPTCSPGLRSATGHCVMPVPRVRSRPRGEDFHG